VGPALVLGDHLLTAAYRVAVEAKSPAFLETFIRSVERTVAGEIAQEKHQGRVLSLEQYREVVTGKSGELFRAVFSLPSHLLGLGSPERVGDVGARLGCLYQMVDDFLDYCPDAKRGKVPLQDFRQGKWTWPLGLLGLDGLHATEAEVLEALFRRPDTSPTSPMEDGVRILEERASGLIRDLSEEGMDTVGLSRLLDGWVRQAREASSKEAELLGRMGDLRASVILSGAVNHPQDEVRNDLLERAEPLANPADRLAYFAKHAKTFRFASRLFPRDALESVAGVYAFCRFTDDMVDDSSHRDPKEVEKELNAWEALARQAYDGPATGIPLLDQVMGEARSRSVPFSYVEELLAGVRMDLRPSGYADLVELKTYSFRVASVVGGWLTELFGIHDPWVLERAYALGHAMQLTNILRDVGEDLRMGRLYLPEDRMAHHGVDRTLLEAKAHHGSAVFPGYRNLLEELMAEAEADYQKAFSGIPFLPSFFRGPVAVAAAAYRGIHDEIRKNGYDNLNRRARTSLFRKVTLALRGLWRLRRVSRRSARVSVADGAAHRAPPPPGALPRNAEQEVPA
jgi:phytoene synthase